MVNPNGNGISATAQQQAAAVTSANGAGSTAAANTAPFTTTFEEGAEGIQMNDRRTGQTGMFVRVSSHSSALLACKAPGWCCTYCGLYATATQQVLGGSNRCAASTSISAFPALDATVCCALLLHADPATLIDARCCATLANKHIWLAVQLLATSSLSSGASTAVAAAPHTLDIRSCPTAVTAAFSSDPSSFCTLSHQQLVADRRLCASGSRYGQAFQHYQGGVQGSRWCRCRHST